jgi:hypothetical protein
MRNLILAFSLSALISASSAAFADQPAANVSASRPVNLAAAHQLSRQIYQKMIAAQKANEFDADGHAQKAKELLEQVNNELKLAIGAGSKNKN